MVRRWVILACLAGAGSLARAQGTAFTYQGRLTESGQAANGQFDLSFSVYDASNAVFSLAGPVVVENVVVSGGLFTVKIDFGAPFAGGDRWLGISVRPGSQSGAFTVLSPRQELTPAPYAVTAAGLKLPMAQTGSTDAGLIPSALLAIRQEGTSNAIMARSASSGAAVRADAAGAGPALHAVAPADGTALLIEGGAIAVKGSEGPFISHEVSPLTSTSNTITLNDPLLNGHPDAILILTSCQGTNWASGASVAPIAAYVAYDTAADRWTIRSFSGNSFPVYSVYNVMVVHRH